MAINAKLQTRRSSVPGKVPTPSSLEIGQLAVNFPDRKLYTKDNNGTIIQLGEGGGNLDPRIAVKNTVSVVGNSMLAYGNIAYSGASNWGVYSNSHIGWCNEMMASYGSQFEVIDFLAVGGATIDDVMVNQVPAALASSSEIIWLHVGITNMSSTGPNNDPIATIITKFIALLEAIVGAKRLIIVDSVLPILQSGTTAAKARAFQIEMLNAAYRKVCANYSNVIYNDIYDAIIDPASAAKNPITGTVRADDGIHFTSMGAKLCGYRSFKNLTDKVNLLPYREAGPNLAPALSGTGGSKVPNTGTINGNVPTGWTVTVATGNAVVTMSSQAPDMTRMSVTNSGGSSSVIYLAISNTSALGALLAEGDMVQAEFGYQLNATPAKLLRIAGTLRANVDTKYTEQCMANSPNEPLNVFVYQQMAGGGVRRNTPFPVSAGVTSFEYIISIFVDASGGTASVDFFAPKVFKLLEP